MFDELNTLLDINTDDLLSEKMALIVEDHSSDAGFLINHLISLYLKCNGNVCLVALTQSFNHFNSIGNKLGVNLNQAKEDGKLIFVDGLKNIGNLMCKNTSVVSSDNQLGLSRMSLHDLFTVITSACEHLAQWKTSPTLILIDDLSVLISLGFKTKEVSSFVHHLRYFCCADPSNKVGFSALIHSDSSEEDDDIDFLHKYMFHMTNLVLEVSGLQSGYCKDVHGELTVTSRNNCQSIPIGNMKKKMQFKIMDKTIKLFAVGTSSAVL